MVPLQWRVWSYDLWSCFYIVIVWYDEDVRQEQSFRFSHCLWESCERECAWFVVNWTRYSLTCTITPHSSSSCKEVMRMKKTGDKRVSRIIDPILLDFELILAQCGLRNRGLNIFMKANCLVDSLSNMICWLKMMDLYYWLSKLVSENFTSRAWFFEHQWISTLGCMLPKKTYTLIFSFDATTLRCYKLCLEDLIHGIYC